MKQLALSLTLGLAALVATPALAVAGDGDAWMNDYDAAVEVAKKEGKNLLVDFTGSDWCGWCIKLDEEVFAHEAWLKSATEDYVLVALDFPRAEEIKAKVPNPKRNKELQNLHGVQGFPTILMMTPAGDVFGRTGYQEGGPEKYLAHMSELEKTGMAQLEAVIKIDEEFAAAEGEAKLPVWNKAADLLEKEGVSYPGSSRLVKIVETAFELDPKDEKGLSSRAIGTLMKAGRYSTKLFDMGLQFDAKNTKGLYEQVLLARMEAVNDDDSMLASLEALSKFQGVNHVVEKENGQRIYMLGAYFAFKHKEDMELARVLATKAVEFGALDNERMAPILNEILGEETPEEEPAEEEEVVEEVGG